MIWIALIWLRMTVNLWVPCNVGKFLVAAQLGFSRGAQLHEVSYTIHD